MRSRNANDRCIVRMFLHRATHVNPQNARVAVRFVSAQEYVAYGARKIPATHHIIPIPTTPFPQPITSFPQHITSFPRRQEHTVLRPTTYPPPSRHSRNHHVIPAVHHVIPAVYHVIPAVYHVIPAPITSFPYPPRHSRNPSRHSHVPTTSFPQPITSFPRRRESIRNTPKPP